MKTQKLEWRNQTLPISIEFEDVYYSADNGLAEARYVFIAGNQLVERWHSLEDNSAFCIGETGFGTGLNFFATWQAWNEHLNTASNKNQWLHYYSAEKFPLNSQEIKLAISAWPELEELVEDFLPNYPDPAFDGVFTLSFPKNRMRLTLIFSDAEKGFNSLSSLPLLKPKEFKNFYTDRNINAAKVDAWFFDGFSPAKNPELWTSSLFLTLAKISSKDTTFSTFTAARTVKNNLQSAGFSFQKTPGFGRKRDMLIGNFSKFDKQVSTDKKVLRQDGRKVSSAWSHGWHLIHSSTNFDKSEAIAIIGGGLAGCLTAWMLASRGYQVDLYEKNLCLASEASGNPQAVVYARFETQTDTLNQFNLRALIYALNFYTQLGAFKKYGDNCGVICLSKNKKQEENFKLFCESLTNRPALADFQSAKVLSTKSKLELTENGMWIADSGWIDPGALCRHLVQHSENIRLHLHNDIDTISYSSEDRCWRLSYGNLNVEHTNLILCSAFLANKFSQTSALPIKPVSGQVTFAEPNETISTRTVLCREGYLLPKKDQQISVGASYRLDSTNIDHSEFENRENIDRIQKILLSPLSQKLRVSGSRTSVRATTPDYHPLVGPVPKTEKMQALFSGYQKNARAIIESAGEYHPGLFILSGLGSRGTCYAPLCADILTSIIDNNGPLPVSTEQYMRLHPSRFIIRKLMKSRTDI